MSENLVVAATKSIVVPRLFAADDRGARRFAEFFAARIRNRHTRRAYRRAIGDFAIWAESHGFAELRDIEPVHVAAYVELLLTRLRAPSVKQHLAAIRMLFDWLVIGQIIAVNPASPVRGPKHVVKRGKTPALLADEARALLDSIDVTTAIGLRDRALIALMVYTFARIGAAVGMKVNEVYAQQRRTWVRLHEKGGKPHDMPCHHNLEVCLHAYIDGVGLAGTGEAFLFRTFLGRTGQLSERPMTQKDAHRMVRRRVAAAGIATLACNHSFRATGITEYLRNDGRLEIAQQMASHESARTTGLYDRRGDQVNLDEVERIRI